MYRLTLGLILTFLFLAGCFFGLYTVSFAGDGIVDGVYVGTLDLSGLTREQAVNELHEFAAKVEETNIVIVYEDIKMQTTAKELGITLDVDDALNKACSAGNTGSIFKRFSERQHIKRHGLRIEPSFIVNDRKFESELSKQAAEIITEPSDAGFKIMPDDSVAIVPGRMGTRIDFPALKSDITGKISRQNEGIVEVNLPVLAVTPRRSTSDIESMGINGLISRYSTSFDAAQAGRTYNIKVAAAALDGLLIAPGDEFSFNRVVGPRSSEAGYKSAGVIINNELVQGVGGGVCQVSSTLYNAVLLANLRITERSNHSLPVGYVPIGRDATVVYGAIDFKFQNNTDFYIYIKTLVEGNKLTVKLYGNKNKTPKVEVHSWITEEIVPEIQYEKDPNLAAGEEVVKQEGKKGFKAAAVRYVWVDGEKKTEKLPGSFYHPVKRIIAVGTGLSNPPVVVPADEDLAPVEFPVTINDETKPTGQDKLEDNVEETGGSGTEEHEAHTEKTSEGPNVNSTGENSYDNDNSPQDGEEDLDIETPQQGTEPEPEPEQGTGDSM